MVQLDGFVQVEPRANWSQKESLVCANDPVPVLSDSWPIPARRNEPAIVSSWNEWDPLRHVIVGRADGTMVQSPEIAVQPDFPTEGFPRGHGGPIPVEFVDRANEQLDTFASLLEGRGIRVDRPVPHDFSRPIRTPNWQQGSAFGCMPVRDTLLTVGPELLEAANSYRSRWFEHLCTRPLVEQYYMDDPAMRWSAAPKPVLAEESFVAGFHDTYWDLPLAEKLGRVRSNDLLLTDTEPMFDAADVGRFGRDLFVKLSFTTNRSGYRWLKQHFPDHRVHPVVFQYDYPMHIDATFVPLAPGIVLLSPERPPEDDLLEYFRVNDWQVVNAAEPMRKPDQLPPLCACTRWLSMNILSLDSRTVCVEASEERQMEQLNQLGFDVVPVPFWDVAAFGGGLHCSTADVRRDGVFEDYFPRRVGRF